MSSDQNQYPALPPLDGQRPSSGARPWPPSPSTFGASSAGGNPYSENGYPDAPPDYSRSSSNIMPPAGATWSALPAVRQQQQQQQQHADPRPFGQQPPDDDDTAFWDPDASVYETCKIEHDRVAHELNELAIVEQQTAKELERLNHLKVLEGARVRDLEEHLETHARQDIRAVYLAAAEAEMRAFMMTEQRDHLREKLRLYGRYEQMLSHLLSALRAAPNAVGQQTPSWNVSSLMPAPNPPGGSMVGLPAINPSQAAFWPVESSLPAASTPPMNPSSAGFPSLAPRGQSELSTLAREIQAQEQVRQRLARRLHDGPTQSLATVFMAAELCEQLISSDPSHALEQLAKLKADVKTSILETRKLIFELRPMTLDDLGLVATLRRYATDLAGARDVHISVSVPGGEQRRPTSIETPIFRVAQEAVVNAIEHAKASAIEISVLTGPDGLRLIVKDNGHGFDVEPALKRARAHETWGIASMLERAELLGGWLKIESAPGRGARVELTVPA
ncbi:MAG TPA: histidine kinase [Ktedonobacterales bacterium]|nr:histidine kinase [Ktedonobacterales bacterium]